MKLRTKIVSCDVQNTKDSISVTVTMEVRLVMDGITLPILRPIVKLVYPRSILSEIMTRSSSGMNVRSAETAHSG